MSQSSNIVVVPIAFVKSKYKGAKGKIPRDSISEIHFVDTMPEDSLVGIEDFSHLQILFHFHLASETSYGKSYPRNNKNNPQVGIFSHRSMNRPNHIGLTLVKLIKREGRILTVMGLDALDGSPVIDIKPVVKRFLPDEEIKQPDWV